MKKYETLKAIVILQAVSMIALAGFVVWYLWPSTKDDEVISPIHDLSKANAEDEVVAVIAEQNITKQQLVDELLLSYGDQTLQNMLEHYAIQYASEEYNIDLTEQEIQDELAIRANHYESVEQYMKVMTEQVGILPQKLYQDIKDELLLTKIAIKDITISDDEVMAYIVKNPESHANRYTLGVEWILVDNEQEAVELLSQLEEGASFGSLALNYSIDEYTANNGGKMGLIDADDELYPEQLRQAALALNVGSVAGPIAIEDNFAIIRVTEKRMIKHVSDDQRRKLVREQLALEQADSLEQVLQRLVNRYNSLIKKQNL